MKENESARSVAARYLGRYPGPTEAPKSLAPYVAAASAGLMCIVGLVMIYSASALPGSLEGGPGEFFYLRKQVVFLLISLGALAFAYKMPLNLVLKCAPLVTALAVAGLALVLVPSIGHEVNGARRWIRYGSFGFQVSDLAKIAVVLFLAWHLGRNGDRARSLLRGAFPALGAVAVLAGLTVIEPDLGTALFIAGLGVVLAVAGGVRWVHLAPPFVTGLAGMVFMMWHKFDHVKDRIAVFLDPTLDPLGKGHQVRQSLIALGSGSVFGNGLGAGRQKLFFLPEDFTDFILALIGEELGLAGTLLVVGCFLAFFLSALAIARKSRSDAGYLVALGAGLIVCMQGFINMAVVTASVPTKGISLPFASYGGSSLIVMMTAVGLLLNVARSSEAVACAKVEEPGPAEPATASA